MPATMKAEEYQERKEQLSGWPVKVVSYRIGGTYYVSIHNEEPGAWIVKGQGATLAEAEGKARKEAGDLLAKVKKSSSASAKGGSASGGGCTSVPGF